MRKETPYRGEGETVDVTDFRGDKQNADFIPDPVWY